MKDKLDALLREGAEKIQAAQTESELQEVKGALLGKQGSITELLKEKMGFDGGTTYVYGRNSFGENLIVMWDAREPQPHYYIRKAIEDLVRAHITVEEGIVYRPELYE